MTEHTKGWSFLHCLRSSARRALQIPDISFTREKERNKDMRIVARMRDWEAGNGMLVTLITICLVILRFRGFTHHNRVEQNGHQRSLPPQQQVHRGSIDHGCLG